MKSLKTKVIMSAFVLLFALVATIGSTYAWFTISDTVNVSDISLTVTTEQSLLIRVKKSTDVGTPGDTVENYTFDGGTGSADNFQNTITNADLTHADAYPSFGSYLLTPVTAANTPLQTNGTDYTLLSSADLSTIDVSATSANRELTSASANQTGINSGYIELEFYLMSQASPATVKLSAFSATGGAAANALYLSTTADSTEKIFAIDSDWGFAFESSDLGYIIQDGTHDNADETTFWNSVPAGSTGGAGDHGIAELQSLESVIPTPGAEVAGDTVITLAADTPEIITVRLWIEGWDADATNAIISEAFTVSFSFSIFTL